MSTTATTRSPKDKPKLPTGRLEWRALLQWLQDDGIVVAQEAERVGKRFAGQSAQHPLVRLGGAGLSDARSGRALDVEALTEWLAAHCALPYLRIDPLKVDVGRVAEIMSINY